MTVGRRAGIVLILLAPVVGAAQSGMPPSAPVDGWNHLISLSKKVGPYRLKGKSIVRSSDSSADRVTEWTSLVDKERYLVEWVDPDGVRRGQSYDGSKWYGITGEGSQARATIIADPAKSAGKDLDDHLRQLGAGLFIPTLTDAWASPVNVGEETLLDLVGRNLRSAKLQPEGERFIVRFKPEPTEKSRPPDFIEFSVRDKYFMPTKVGFSFGDSSSMRVEIEPDFDTLAVAAPRRIRVAQTFPSATGNAGSLTNDIALEWTSVPPPDAEDFRLKFPAGSKVFDDRIAPSGQVPVVSFLVQHASSVAVALLVLGGVLMLVFGRRMRE